MLHKREPIALDLDKVFEKASELGILMEVNCLPERLDLSDINCHKARDFDFKIAINTDSHDKSHLRYMELGVATARRGWLEAPKVINTLAYNDFKKELGL